MSNTKSKTLREILEDHYEHQWRHMRSGKTLYSQAKAAVDAIMEEAAPLSLDVRPSGGIFTKMAPIEPKEVGKEAIKKVTKRWYEEGLSPATITKRLNCLSVLGVNVEGTRPPKERKLKWWLRPEERKSALEWLDERADMLHTTDLLRVIEWTCFTGLRIEETLALTRGDFHGDFMSVSVPGTKTAAAQASLPLAPEARAVVIHVFPVAVCYAGNTPFIRASYRDLAALWVSLREAMGWPKEATLKGLRRTAARYLHVDCGMPLDMVRQYLRHEDIATTMEYLRLTGGYEVEEMRRYL